MVPRGELSKDFRNLIEIAATSAARENWERDGALNVSIAKAR